MNHPCLSPTAAGRARLAFLCEGALAELLSERAEARPAERLLLDHQIDTFRDMLRWARSAH